ncbi:zinc finger protein 653 [Salmo salar]|uniref:Zinc finger protein 653 n=1 Tax=Salmo salar TaxID=8030 RepID=A0A1S3RA46_SALSA|nr:zinc finger protein 653 [Salmo salar]|eukprot:XP_014049001.1 PREDICTED: zinc finger protein 653-like isoform X1 [Salmo salar]
MADGYGGEEGPLDAEEAGDQIKSISRRCRGRPRLTDSDRAQRRLESRKKYDVRRVYLGESHKVWSELRRRTSLSDAGLAEYLILLNSTYGERYQQKYGGKTTPEVCAKLKIGKNKRVSSLCSMVTWYQDHSQTCPHEPQLRALEPQPGFSTSAIWQCDADHSFVQHLSSPPRGASEMETETEEEVDRDTRTEETGGIMTRRRRRETDAHRQLTDAGGDLEVAGAPVTMDQVEQATALSQLPGMEAPSRDSPLMEHLSENQSVWEMEVVMEAGRQQAQESDDEEKGYNALGEDINPEEEAEDLRRDRGDEGVGTSQDGYECVVVTASLTDRLDKADEEDTTQTMGDTAGVDTQTNLHPVPASMQVPGQGELFHSQTLQTVGTTCEIPDQRGTLDGSQLIIITGPSYEALASEGIQLNMGGGDVEEVTCTVIEGVAYNQMCQSVADFRTTEEDSITGLSDKELLQPSVESHCLEPTCERELQRGLSRCRRSRRGPVIEADGMLKMFHCPYEGCSQVYVAISSFQNHVNLVHRKGRTKVCPHPGCGKKFYLSNHLHRHMIIHSGVRDFICETCGKSFKRKNHLEVHRRTHTGETPLQCEICGYQCRQRASLNWHMKKHTPEAHYNFTCEHCGKRFEKLDSVKFHKLKSHPDKQAT